MGKYKGFEDAKEVISAPKRFWEGTKKTTGRIGDYSGIYNLGRGTLGAVKAYVFGQPVELADRSAQAASTLPQFFRIFQLKRRVSGLEKELEHAQAQYKKDIGRTIPRPDDTPLDKLKNHVSDAAERLDDYTLEDGIDKAKDGGTYVASKAATAAGAVGRGTAGLVGKLAQGGKGLLGRFRNRGQDESTPELDDPNVIDAEYSEKPKDTPQGPNDPKDEDKD